MDDSKSDSNNNEDTPTPTMVTCQQPVSLASHEEPSTTIRTKEFYDPRYCVLQHYKKMLDTEREMEQPRTTNGGDTEYTQGGVEEGGPSNGDPPRSSGVDGEEMSCKFCGKKFSSDEELQEHLVLHLGKKPFKCETCGHRFSVKSNLLYHIQQGPCASSNNKPSLLSTSTSSGASLATDFQSNEARHNSRSPAESSSLGSVEQEVSLLSPEEMTVEYPSTFPGIKHKISVRNQTVVVSRLEGINMSTGQQSNLYKCHLCNKVFSYLSKLQCHMSLHYERNLTVYQCHLCDIHFRFRTQLRHHMRRIHHIADSASPSQESPVDEDSNMNNSESGCGNSGYLSFTSQRGFFPSGNDNAASRSSPPQGMPFRKDSRSKRSGYSRSNGSYVCRYCNRSFDRMFSLHRHERIHTGYKPCYCSHCGKGFSEPRNLRHHTIRYHSDGSQLHLLRRRRRPVSDPPHTTSTPSSPEQAANPPNLLESEQDAPNQSEAVPNQSELDPSQSELVSERVSNKSELVPNQSEIADNQCEPFPESTTDEGRKTQDTSYELLDKEHSKTTSNIVSPGYYRRDDEDQMTSPTDLTLKKENHDAEIMEIKPLDKDQMQAHERQRFKDQEYHRSYSFDQHHHEQDEQGHRQDDRGHRQDDRGHRQDDRGHRQDDRGHRQDDRGHRQDDRGHRQEDRGHRQEDRGHRPEDRGHHQEDRGHHKNEQSREERNRQQEEIRYKLRDRRQQAHLAGYQAGQAFLNERVERGQELVIRQTESLGEDVTVVIPSDAPLDTKDLHTPKSTASDSTTWAGNANKSSEERSEVIASAPVKSIMGMQLWRQRRKSGVSGGTTTTPPAGEMSEQRTPTEEGSPSTCKPSLTPISPPIDQKPGPLSLSQLPGITAALNLPFNPLSISTFNMAASMSGLLPSPVISPLYAPQPGGLGSPPMHMPFYSPLQSSSAFLPNVPLSSTHKNPSTPTTPPGEPLPSTSKTPSTPGDPPMYDNDSSSSPTGWDESGKHSDGKSLSRSHSSRLYVVRQPVKREEACKPTLLPNGRMVYRCTYCNKEFCTVSDVNRHMDFHEDIRPYKCKFCEYYARTNSQLKVHMMRHQGIREFHCRLCSYKGVTQSDLNRHMKSQIHMMKARNECKHCGEGFVSPMNLEKHYHEKHLAQYEHITGGPGSQVLPTSVREAPPRKPRHECKLCNEGFMSPLELEKHYHDKHYTQLRAAETVRHSGGH